MYTPPDLAKVVLIITSGAAHALTIGALVPAPAAGSRLRVWAVTLGTWDTTQAPGAWKGGLDNTDGAGIVTISSGTGHDSKTVELPGGLALPAGAPGNYYLQSALAGLLMVFAAYYTVEQV